jgi:hypothetical protein
MANSYSSGDWRLEKASAMVLPAVGIKRGTDRTRLSGLFLRGTPAEGLMNATAVVMDVGADAFLTHPPGAHRQSSQGPRNRNCRMPCNALRSVSPGAVLWSVSGSVLTPYVERLDPSRPTTPDCPPRVRNCSLHRASRGASIYFRSEPSCGASRFAKVLKKTRRSL